MWLPKRHLVVDKLRTGLWVSPAFSAISAFALAKMLPIVDAQIPAHRNAWYLFAGQADSARQFLSAITSSMMTFTGLVFSITILVLQLASSQFSPRVIRTFLEDRWTQIAMGVFVGSFVYAMALLPQIRGETQGHPALVPALSVFVAFLLVLLSVGVFVRYIHHMAHAIRVVNIIRHVADDARQTVEVAFRACEQPTTTVPIPTSAPDATVANKRRPGVVASLDEEQLFKLAVEHAVTVEVVPMVGDFVPRGGVLLRIWGPARRELPERLAPCVALSEERTPHHDPAFGVRQLVDIAERALSPGTNDPTTAVQVLDQLHDLLRDLAARPWPSNVRVSDEGVPRLIVHRLSWPGFVRLALDEIRGYGSSSIQVMRKMRTLLDDLRTVALADRQAVLDEQLALLAACAHIAGPARARETRSLPSVQSPRGHEAPWEQPPDR